MSLSKGHIETAFQSVFTIKRSMPFFININLLTACPIEIPCLQSQERLLGCKNYSAE